MSALLLLQTPCITKNSDVSQYGQKTVKYPLGSETTTELFLLHKSTLHTFVSVGVSSHSNLHSLHFMSVLTCIKLSKLKLALSSHSSKWLFGQSDKNGCSTTPGLQCGGLPLGHAPQCAHLGADNNADGSTHPGSPSSRHVFYVPSMCIQNQVAKIRIQLELDHETDMSEHPGRSSSWRAGRQRRRRGRHWHHWNDGDGWIFSGQNQVDKIWIQVEFD